MSEWAHMPNIPLFSHSTVTHTGQAFQLKVSGKQNGAALRLLASAVWLAIVLHNPCVQRRCVIPVKCALLEGSEWDILVFKHL